MKRYEVHPLAEHAPELAKEAFDELTADIVAHGLQLPIIVFEDKILDGRHRERVCYAREIKPKYEQFKGSFEEAKAYVWSLNGVRRQLTAGQKASLAAGLATAPHGGDRTKPTTGQDAAKTVAQVSKETGVGVRTIERAKSVQKNTPAIAKQVEAGEKTVRAAEQQTKEVKSGKKTEKEAVAEKKPPAKKATKTEKATNGDVYYLVTVGHLMDISSCSLGEINKWIKVHNIERGRRK